MSDERVSSEALAGGPAGSLVPDPPPSLVPPRDSVRPVARLCPEPPLSEPPLSEGRGAASLTEARARRRSLLPPPPALEPIVERAERARREERWEEALDEYKKALFVLSSTAQVEARAQASIYASVAEVRLAQGKAREAETNFEKAIALDPKHTRALEALVSIATEASDWERAVVARRRRADALDDPFDKAAELVLVAEIERGRLGALDKAIETLEIASALCPDDIGALAKLRELCEERRDYPRLLEVLDRLVRLSTDPRERGALRFAQADVALGRFREEPRGLAFLEMALDEDPQCDRALSALVAVRSRREEWVELAAIYERLVDRYAGLGDRDRAWEACRKLGVLRRDRLLDGPGALEALSGALELRPDDPETRAALAELYAAKGDRAAAVRELERVAASAPLRAQTYRRLFELHQRAQRQDRAWLVATCLEELGASDLSQELVIEQFRPDGAIRPTAAVEGAWWDELMADDADPFIAEILQAVGEAAVALRLEELEAAKKLLRLDPSDKQDKTSTASAVRTFVWAARALGVALPELYVLDEVPSGAAAVPAKTPTTALGPQVLSGRTVQELAFIAGRHLTYYRPAYYPLVFFPTLAELSSLVLTAVGLVIPAISAPPRPDGGGRIERELGARLRAEQRQALEDVVARLDARGGTLDPLGWIRGVERTATRAGLLLCGDLRVATRVMNGEERAVGDVSLEEKRGDLLAYSASARLAQLRERMGVGAATAE